MNNVAGGEGDRAGRGHAKTMLQLGALFGLWHLFTICNKQIQILKVFPCPMNTTTVQFAAGTAVALLMWTTGILERPKVSGAQLASILPLAIVHTMVNLFTSIIPGKIAVSFTHIDTAHVVLKHSSPVLIPSMIFLGVLLIPWIVLCLVQNMTFRSRNVLPRGYLAAVNLFLVITVMSFFLLALVTFLTKRVKVTHEVLQSMGLNLQQMYTRLIFVA